MHAPGITQKGIDISNRNDCFHLEETSEHIENCFASCIPTVIVKPIVMDFKNPTLEAISYHPHIYLYLLSCNREIKYIENESLDKCGTFDLLFNPRHIFLTHILPPRS